jgi:gliding motility-associated-like protein
MMRFIYLISFIITSFAEIKAQCSSGITTFPYNEGFEASNGGWTSGGAGNDWAWGTPTKPVISAAGGGSKCWVIGGLTGTSYTNAEASWIQSPCFDFTNVQYPYIEFKVFWEMEQRFDGASLQYSTDNGNTWQTVGSAGDAKNCLNDNWFNNSGITYLSPLSSDRNGWSGNIQPGAGSCNGGSGSNGWVTAKHTMPSLAGEPGVLFRFIFGAGTICNNYDGFAVDDILIGEAPPNAAAFTYSCVNNNTANFTNTSALCPTTFSWNFGDVASGLNNTATTTNPSHTFSAPGNYTVTLTVSGPGNAPSTTTRQITILNVTTTMLSMADCQTNTGGSLIVSVEGTTAPLNILWNTVPPQTTTIATNLATGVYSVTISGTDVCTVTTPGKVETDISCIGIFFPSGFTPNNDGRNDGFGPLGSLAVLSDYRFSVYNRWGEKIFSSANPFEKWNGTIKGTDTDSNIFVWYAEFSVSGKPKELRKGTVMLIR